MPDTYAAIDKLRREVFSRIGRDPSTISSFAEDFPRILDSIASEESAKSQSLQPWVALLEHSIMWISSFHMALIQHTSDPQASSLIKVAAVLTGAGSAHATAIRRLCLAGLDASAKVVLRTLVETLEILLLTWFDSNLRETYFRAQEFEQAYALWRSSLTGRPMEAAMSALLGTLGYDDAFVSLIRDWQREEKELMSQAVHTSYVAAAFASMPKSSVHPDRFVPGFVGASSAFSLRTLRSATGSIWLLAACLETSLLQLLSSPPFHPDTAAPGDSPVATLISELDVFPQLALAYWPGRVDGPEDPD